MANIIAIADPDPIRRRQYLETIRPRVDLRDGLECGSLEAGDTAVLWAARRGGPLEVWEDDGDFAVVWGDPNCDTRPGRCSARAIFQDWMADRPQVYGGYYACLTRSRAGGLRFGCDVLGLFPVYWWQRGPVLLVGSSPELFRHHPLFQMEVSLAGLAGILIQNGLVGGRALLKGVQRAGAGHVLSREPGKVAAEVRTFRVPATDQYHGMSISALTGLFSDTMSGALSKALPGMAERAMLLSGGLDSRVLAAGLRTMAGPTLAITRGLQSDIEMNCASQVARVLGFTHRAVAPNPGLAVEGAIERVRWEHMANGFRSVIGGLREDLGEVPPRIMTGYLFDHVMWSGKARLDSQDWDSSFARWFAKQTLWGIPPDTVSQLLGAPEVVEEVVDDLRTAFRQSAQHPAWARRATYLSHQGRFRVGGNLWSLSFLSWPWTPALDLEVLRVAGGMPMAAMAERVVIKDFLIRFHPDLAAIPVDHNNMAPWPLKPRLRFLLTDFALTGTGIHKARRWLAERRHHEPRYYYRDGDFDGPGWRSVRAAAEPFRGRLAGVMNRDVLDRLVPPPERIVAPDEKLKSTGGAKLLTGMMLWASDHL